MVKCFGLTKIEGIGEEQGGEGEDRNGMEEEEYEWREGREEEIC